MKKILAATLATLIFVATTAVMIVLIYAMAKYPTAFLIVVSVAMSVGVIYKMAEYFHARL